MHMLSEISDVRFPGVPAVAFFDLDGTLVNSSGEINRTTQNALARLQSLGTRVCIATGRPYFATSEIIKTLKIHEPSMFFSGALIVDPLNGRPLHLEYLEQETLEVIIKKARQLNLYTEVYSVERYYVDKFSDYTSIHTEYLGKDPIERDILEVVESEKIVKVGIMVPRGSEMEYERRFREVLPLIPNAIAYGAAHPNVAFLNFTSARASRELAFDFFMKLFQTSSSEVMSFGDGHSDIPFLKLAGCGVAMLNGDPEVHAAANYVTKSVEEDGVAYALDRLILS